MKRSLLIVHEGGAWDDDRDTWLADGLLVGVFFYVTACCFGALVDLVFSALVKS